MGGITQFGSKASTVSTYSTKILSKHRDLRIADGKSANIWPIILQMYRVMLGCAVQGATELVSNGHNDQV